MKFIIFTFPSQILYFISIITTLISCGGTTHLLSSGQFSNKEKYEINSYFGCCGCSAKFFMINSGKRKIEQVIYSYNCNIAGKPTKFIFNYNDVGKLISCKKYVATTEDDYILTLNEQERHIFSILDTSTLMKANDTTIKLSEIKGFRIPVDNEVTHSFPIIKKGYKLPVQ